MVGMSGLSVPVLGRSVAWRTRSLSQLKNKPGELLRLARALVARGIDTRHSAGAGAGDLGCTLVTTSDDDAHPKAHAAPCWIEVGNVGVAD